MTVLELLQNGSDALIANDAATLEQLVQEAADLTGTLRMSGARDLAARLSSATEVLRQQVSAASVQLDVRRRLGARGNTQVHPWER